MNEPAIHGLSLPAAEGPTPEPAPPAPPKEPEASDPFHDGEVYGEMGVMGLADQINDLATQFFRRPEGGELLKSLERRGLSTPLAPRDVRTKFFDPFRVFQADVEGRRIVPRAGPVDFRYMRMMAQTEVAAAIIFTRTNQVARFSRIAKRPGQDVGFIISHVDEEHKVTKREQQEIKALEDFFLRTGFSPFFDPRLNPNDRRDNFQKFLRRVTRDRLTLDQIAIELVPPRSRRAKQGDIAEFWAIDAATINPRIDPDNSAILGYVQMDRHSRPVADYEPQDIIWDCSNPRTDIEVGYYGLSELEVAIRIITGLINGIRYNISAMTQNSIPLGLLSIMGNFSQEMLQSFKRQWYAQLLGPANRWKVPMIALRDGKKVEWINMKGTSKEMEYHRWMIFQVNLLCSLYCIDPGEIGFEAYRAASQTLQERSRVEVIEKSQDRGLRPLLDFLSEVFNQYVMPRLFGGKYSFGWSGLDPENEKERHDIAHSRMDHGYLTIRQRYEEEDREIPKGHEEMAYLDMPLQSYASQLFIDEWRQQQQAEMGGQMGGQAGAEGGGLPPELMGQFGGGRPGGRQEEGAPGREGRVGPEKGRPREERGAERGGGYELTEEDLIRKSIEAEPDLTIRFSRRE